MIMRKRGNYYKERKINSRKWEGGECGIPIEENGEEWETIPISQWRLYLKDAFVKHVLASPYEIYEILMGHNRELNPRKKLRIGATGNAGVVAICVMVETIVGTVGGLARVDVTAALAER